MLLVSHKMAFMEKEAALLRVTILERARAFVANLVYKIFRYNFRNHKVQFLWGTFGTHFGMGTRHFQKVVLIVICHFPYG